jgi:fucose 4-O-acetylase-like acetyltransferase
MEFVIEKRRDTALDSIKFVIIALVVLGHTFQLDMVGLNANLFSFGVSFRMPIFIMMSGYFYRDSESGKFWRGFFELLLIIIIFQVIYFSSGWLDPFDFSIGGAWRRITHFYIPSRALWYIFSLCFWRLIMRYYPRKIRDNFKITIPIAFCVSLLAGFAPQDIGYTFQKTLVFFPYFLLGYYIHKYDLWKKIRALNKIKCGIFIIIYFVLIMLIPNFPDSMCTGNFSYFVGLADWRVMFVLRAVSYFWMLPLAICVMNVIPDCPLFAEQGKNTMFYYLYHPFFIWLMNWFVINYNLPTSAFFLVIYTIISLYAMYWLSKIPLLVYLTKPITSIRSKL